MSAQYNIYKVFFIQNMFVLFNIAMDFDILVFTWLIWDFQHNLWSIIIINLFSYTLSISSLLIVSFTLLLLCRLLNIINFVLLKFSESLLTSNHFLKTLNSNSTVFRSCSNFSQNNINWYHQQTKTIFNTLDTLQISDTVVLVKARKKTHNQIFAKTWGMEESMLVDEFQS